jgi:predicted ABC-type ATPase
MPRRAATPQLYVIAGPNGAGKTTFAREFLPHFAKCREFVNADLLAAGLSPFAPERASFAAGRLMLERIQRLAERRADFGFETTLAGRGYAPLLRQMKSAGYRLNLFFLWLPSADLAVARVADRVRHGGHHVPEPVVRRRFVAGLRNFFHLYAPLAAQWILFDSSQSRPQKLATSVRGKLTIANPTLYRQIHQQAGL